MWDQFSYLADNELVVLARKSDDPLVRALADRLEEKTELPKKDTRYVKEERHDPRG